MGITCLMIDHFSWGFFFQVNQTADPSGHKNRFVVDAGGGGSPVSPVGPDLKPWEVVWSDWCVTSAHWIWNGDDSTVTVWWHCDCFIGICMGLCELLKTCVWREGTEQLCHLLRQLSFQSICKTCITEVSCGKTVSRGNKNIPRISRICLQNLWQLH